MKSKMLMIIAWILILSPSSRAETLGWEDCVRLAEKNNPALQAAIENFSAAHDSTLSSRNGFLPQASGSLGYTYGNSASVSGSGVVLGGGSSNGTGNYAAGISITENLFNGLTDLAKVNQAKANEGIVNSALLKVKAQVGYNLKVAFEALDYAMKSEKLAKEIIARRDQNLKLVELRFKVGRENKGSVLLYQAYLKDAKYGDLQSRDSALTSKAQLAQALGLDEFDSFEITGSVPTHDPEPVDLKKLSLSTPLYLQALYQEKSADQAITLARAGFFPTLALNSSLGKSGPDWFPKNDHWSVGINLTIPLFNGGRDYYATKAAVEAHSAADLTLHDTAHQVLSQLQQSHMAYIEAIEKLQVDMSYLEAARVRVDIARADYKNALTSFQDWDLAETDLINREKNLLTSQQSRIVAEAAWEQAQGKGSIP